MRITRRITRKRALFLLIVLVISLVVWELLSPESLRLLEEERYEEMKVSGDWLMDYETIETNYGSLRILIAILPAEVPGWLTRGSPMLTKILIGKLLENITNPLITGFTITILGVKEESQYFELLKFSYEWWWNMGDHIVAISSLVKDSEPPLNSTLTIEVTYKLYALMPIGYIPLQELIHQFVLTVK